MRSIIQQQHAGVIQLLVGTSRFHQHMWDLVHVLVFFPSSSSTQVASFKNTYDYFSWKFKWAHKGNKPTTRWYFNVLMRVGSQPTLCCGLVAYYSR
jgi:hypothetical protein